jgi:hypothetical protein
MRRHYTKAELARLGIVIFGVPTAILFALGFIRLSYGPNGPGIWSIEFGVCLVVALIIYVPVGYAVGVVIWNLLGRQGPPK